jgi:hypothetical protein
MWYSLEIVLIEYPTYTAISLRNNEISKNFLSFKYHILHYEKSGFMKYAIDKTLTNQWLTNYGTILSSEDAYKYYTEEFQNIMR